MVCCRLVCFLLTIDHLQDQTALGTKLLRDAAPQSVQAS
jgi:hypothetical protein